MKTLKKKKKFDFSAYYVIGKFVLFFLLIILAIGTCTHYSGSTTSKEVLLDLSDYVVIVDGSGKIHYTGNVEGYGFLTGSNLSSHQVERTNGTARALFMETTKYDRHGEYSGTFICSTPIKIFLPYGYRINIDCSRTYNFD